MSDSFDYDKIRQLRILEYKAISKARNGSGIVDSKQRGHTLEEFNAALHEGAKTLPNQNQRRSLLDINISASDLSLPYSPEFGYD